MKDQFIRLPIIATNTHCSDDCPSMITTMTRSNDRCSYFRIFLDKDPKRLVNANRRLEACRKAQNSEN
jgi:hypothetical protein